MTPEETAETFRSKLNGGPDARDAAIAEIASAIREAVEAECLEIIKIIQGFREDGETDLRSLQAAIRSRSDKPAITPKESA